MDEKFKQLIAEALELDDSGLVEDLVLDPEDNWDSIALLSVISEIDTQYGIQLDGDNLANCRKISEIYTLIKIIIITIINKIYWTTIIKLNTSINIVQI